MNDSVARDFQAVRVECVKGDITHQTDMDAIVNAANAELGPGSGVAGAIHLAAGPELEEECRFQAPIHTGEAVITSAQGLPNRHVIHCLGPVYGRDEPADQLLASCYRRALDLAERHSLVSIAFPAIATGAFGFPPREAAKIAMKTVLTQLSGLRSLRRVRFVLLSQQDLDRYRRLLEDYQP